METRGSGPLESTIDVLDVLPVVPFEIVFVAVFDGNETDFFLWSGFFPRHI